MSIWQRFPLYRLVYQRGYEGSRSSTGDGDMTYDYFYGNQSDQFSFYRIPKALFTDEHFKTISAESKILYGILLDRMNLSQKNGWLDPDGRVYIIFTVEEITEAFHCASQKAVKVISAQNSHYLSTFLLRFPKKGRLPLYQVVESFRPAMASAYKLAQANMAYSRFSFFISPRYTVFL